MNHPLEARKTRAYVPVDSARLVSCSDSAISANC
ncbi:hypothetical protein MAR_007946 [Mya arenaria]|uniref:Uncharacterized protein n=1 Tax=Mya arenaria TaxID=6604 RepID=A0ABY7DXM4_MYAAR|nr:hypothetical protein MAR_007946 [Mya arenaria]